MAREHTTPTADRSKTADSVTRAPQNRGATSAVLQRLEQAPQTLRPADVLQLQRSIGNRATGLLLQTKLKLGPAGDQYEQEADQVAKQVVAASRQPEVQREEGEEGTVQASRYADSIADYQRSATPVAAGISRVQRVFVAQPHMPKVQREEVDDEMMQAKPLVESSTKAQGFFVARPSMPKVQREEMEDELQASPNHGLEGGDVDTDVARSILSVKGGGQPLHDGVRSSMEKGFGADFGGVRVHTGGQADALNRSLNARAFTTGKDIFFGKGQYNPGSTGGQELIAHELTHTVQQGAAGAQRVQRYFQLPAAGQGGGGPEYTAQVGAQFLSQEFKEGTASRIERVKQGDGSINSNRQDFNGGAGGWQLPGPAANTPANSLSLNVSETGEMAIENTTAQPRNFFATQATITNSNIALRNVASIVRLHQGGGTVSVPTNPDPLHHDPTPKQLHMVTPEANVPVDHPGREAGNALLDAYSTSECDNVIRKVLGVGESLRKAVVGRQVEGSETEINAPSGSEPIHSLANFVSTTDVGSTHVGNFTAAATNPVPNLAKPGVETNYSRMPNPVPGELGINEQALPEVGEGYAIRSMGNLARQQVTFSNVSGLDGDDTYLEALTALHNANGNINDILRNLALDQQVANRAMNQKSFWGEHYAGVVAKDGGDTVTFENFNRAPQWKWPINEAFNNLYLTMAEFRTFTRNYLNNLGEAITTGNYARQREIIQAFNADLVNHAPLPVLQQQTIQEAVNTSQGMLNTTSLQARDMLYFQMYGQAAGQSFHEVFTRSTNPMAATANSMTLRVRASFNDYKVQQQNALNNKVGQISVQLNTPTPEPILNHQRANWYHAFTGDAAQLVIDMNGAATIREVAVVMSDLKRIGDAIAQNLEYELIRLEPTAVPPGNRMNLPNYIQTTFIDNYHIGKNPFTRGDRLQHKRALQTIAGIAAVV